MPFLNAFHYQIVSNLDCFFLNWSPENFTTSFKRKASPGAGGVFQGGKSTYLASISEFKPHYLQECLM
jgi:hypothetical protein